MSIPRRELSGMLRCRCRHTDRTSLTPGTPKPLFLHKNQHQRPQTPRGGRGRKAQRSPTRLERSPPRSLPREVNS